ncbi:scavenger mRNA decapping enzyme (DcpS) N-terminal family protein [Yamadazyma tenuis]|uniref:m7GpppX diphosphatase n=1 Tax=Candida tenuis (strain ATCC 10573 / BCRC 21748 / CBS 615 / JCM 9827 / NBRC 10315 / NRRL Y-1498 / VKM Y-70) TaxID=590646 RepID=G3BFH7_CANTC|nr:scavenger mRNA decapping enzyme [Yamadazyma tenuis ATCC 10573]XP_006690440.1 uncharacterized protein CANTEDRAFT_116751 [Yamadazyma tenuis ATCC 10573]EGV61225.1 scavenger mRNA decapping enzyme [Yamadazyma tenuis ATCC 10573]EGV61226.1 hypothetical protein CANTEDRAFT_116751 [Yamadazyma tenuis ATCC 10573]WEJ94051.1 scavenger mRNA decapping enzyme (DcpS) N-terminal family protein [Yamadazyma tenuis]
MSDISSLISGFQFKQVLQSDPQTKNIALLGTINNENAIVSLEKSHFFISNDTVDINQTVQELQLIQNNDVYYWSAASLVQKLPDLPAAKLNLIYPATETHIQKLSTQVSHYVLETPQMYQEFAVSYIESMKGDRIKWVYNILFEGKESETFVYHDKDPETGFVLLPDMKWDRVSMDSLYLCCIVNRTDISSVRDLNASHASYLQALRNKILEVTCEKYNIQPDQLRLFIHYHPSYYHFHIHCVTIKHPGLGNGINVGKAILLDDVIENIQLASDYYQKKTIGFILGENHGLWNVDGYRNAHLQH